MLQRSLIPAPGRQKVVFHVEHAPVQVTTPFLCPTRYQGVGPWLKANHGTFADHLTQGGGLSIQPSLPARTLPTKPNPPYSTVRMPYLPIHRQRPCPSLQERVPGTASKRSSMRKKKGGLQNTRLPRAVGADERVNAASQRQIHAGKTAEPVNTQAFQLHGRRAYARTPERLATTPALDMLMPASKACTASIIRDATA